MTTTAARILIAGTGGDSGKTVVSLGLLAAWTDRGAVTRAFKKGPDFIDAAWLGWAAGSPGRNLDTYMMGPAAAARSFAGHAVRDGLNLIEGNRGLLDGLDADGTHSSASLARLLNCPTVLVVSPVKTTATAAATVLGCRELADGVDLAGVILNRVAGARHESIVRRAIEDHAGLPVLGALPRVRGPVLTSRHLGLVPPAEHGPSDELRETLSRLVRENCDLERIEAAARGAAPLDVAAPEPVPAGLGKVRIGYFSDSAFTFYYPENLEALERGGAELTAVSALSDATLPGIDALYIGGGFPETHAERLGANRALHAAVRRAARDGLPIYAECGGLMFLAEALETEGRRTPMAGVLPVTVRMDARPRGHGYCEMRVDAPNPFFAVGTGLRGHEFHYSQVVDMAGADTALAVERGEGCGGGRDGIVLGGTFASYLHLHAAGCPEWAEGLLRAAARRRDRRDGEPDER